MTTACVDGDRLTSQRRR